MRALLIASISVLALAACQTTTDTETKSEPVAENTVKNAQGEFTVFDGKEHKPVQSSPAIVAPKGEIMTSVRIPAEYRTLADGSTLLLRPGSSQSVSKQSPSLSSGQIPAGAITAIPGPSAEEEFVIETVPAEYETVTEKVMVQAETADYITIPAEYETVTEPVIVQEASTELVTIPGKFEWVDGEIDGTHPAMTTIPAEYETVTETVVVQSASSELVIVPPVYDTLPDGRVVVKSPASTTERVVPVITKQATRRVVKTPARVVETVVPNEIKDGKTRVMIEAPTTIERVVPSVVKMETRRVVKTPARIVERVIPAGEREIERRVMKKPESYVVRNAEGKIIKRFDNADEFAKFQANPYKRVSDKPVSTFSADVDTASYSFARQFIQRGQKPPAGSIRIEEMVNYFDYDYDKPISKSEPFQPSITIVPSPWNAETRLIHIGVQGFEAPSQSPQARPDMNLVFLVDISGSMRPANKLPLLKKSFEPLIQQLRPQDTISIVTYAGQASIALESVSGDRKDEIRGAIAKLGAGGSTAGAAGIQSAYELAAKNFSKSGTNRVILATDGDFNVGLSGIDALKAFISDKRKSGIYLSVLGFGQGNLKDHRMQTLAQNGNGIAGYIDSLKEARKFFEQDMGKNMLPIADDLKLQVEFNPERVAEYRLIGYETRALKRQDFNNDKIDAGDVGQGHSVTAIYEINPKGSPRQFVDPLRYGKEAAKIDTSFVNEYGFLKIRYKRPGEVKSSLMSAPITDKTRFDAIDIAPASTRFAVAVAAYGLKLRGDDYMEPMTWDAVIELALNAKGFDQFGHRAEFVDLTRSAKVIGE